MPEGAGVLGVSPLEQQLLRSITEYFANQVDQQLTRVVSHVEEQIEPGDYWLVDESTTGVEEVSGPSLP